MPRLTQLDDVLFPVEECRVFVCLEDANGEHQLSVPDKKAIVTSSNSRVLGIVSRSYRLVTNREALDLGLQCCRIVFPETHPSEWNVMAVDAPETAGHCRIDFRHNSTALDFSFPPEQPDVFGPFIRVTNSYNTLRALAFDIGFFRKVCTNGLIAPDSIIQFKFTHQRRDIGDGIRFEFHQDRLAKLKTSFVEQINALRAVRVPREQHEPLIQAVLLLRPPEPLEPNTKEADEWKLLSRHVDELGGRYAEELGENAYAVFNAVTEFASHPPANRRVRRERHSLQRMAGAWLNSFSQRCRQPDFNLASYIAELTTRDSEALSQ
jgi:hypothetical protein